MQVSPHQATENRRHGNPEGPGTEAEQHAPRGAFGGSGEREGGSERQRGGEEEVAAEGGPGPFEGGAGEEEAVVGPDGSGEQPDGRGDGEKRDEQAPTSSFGFFVVPARPPGGDPAGKGEQVPGDEEPEPGADGGAPDEVVGEVELRADGEGAVDGELEVEDEPSGG
ncbi:hypothetical protein ACIRSS_29645 [Amycolatopsis sp. NPDC101161]|uniref:hypothetical protein n=1 Tax=Amycolatopsis sp. NPDC101161 TaxID=3363940 RepID=UPI00381041AC